MNQIQNFTKSSILEVKSNVHPDCGQLVSLTHQAGSLYLNFSMRPEMARQLAALLVQQADKLEQQQ